VRTDFVVCPICHTQLKKSCSDCEKALHLRWAICPYCGAVQSEGTVALGRVEQPALPEVVPSEI
jgi:RNA polymerase subunit RPABC4/transcription elongation factor Spt4